MWMRAVICAVSFCCVSAGLGNAALAQLAPYNPYAPSEDDSLPVVADDGKLNWPTFYKSAAIRTKFQSYFAMGSCVGTNKAINSLLANNQLDIDKLAMKTLTGRAVRAQGGVISMLDVTGKPIEVITHPAGVSRVKVDGPMGVESLAPRMFVRFVGQVDEHGSGVGTVDTLEVITPKADFRWREVEAGRRVTVTAQVLKIKDRRLQVQVPKGKIRRLAYLLDEQTKVTVDASDVALIAPGDAVSAKGHLYSGANPPVLFADDVTATKGPQALVTEVAQSSAK
jgi:hypothetical protein